jgi:undecaprenyl-diphosphatase
MISSLVHALDLSVLRALYCGSGTRSVVTIVATVSFLGSGWMLLPLLGGLLHKALRHQFAWLLASIVATSAVASLLKACVGRVRPCHAVAWVSSGYVQAPVDPSWPSGHAAGVFAFAAFLWVVDRRWGAAAAVIATLVAMSRVALGVHYPTDVLSGACLGAAIGFGAARLAALRATARL